jgi:hypothetical protein
VEAVDVGFPPWVIEESKHVFDQRILPLLMDDDSHYRLYSKIGYSHLYFLGNSNCNLKH